MSLFGSITKKFHFGKKSTFRKVEIHPERDWVVALEVFVIGVVVFVGISGFLYVGVDTDASFEDGFNTVETRKIIDQELLDETILYFEEKQSDFDSFRFTSPEAPRI